MVHSTDIVEFELRSKKFSLAVRKKEALEVPEPVYLPVSAAAKMGCACSHPAAIWVRLQILLKIIETAALCLQPG